MRRSALIPRILPSLLGVFLLASCEKPKGSPDWTRSRPSIEKPTEVPGPRPIEPEPRPASAATIRLLVHNVENWLTMERADGVSATKPEAEKKALIELFSGSNPNVLGLCEVGTEADLREIQTRMNHAGISLPHLHLAGGSDPTRRLGLLSSFPIVATDKPLKISFRIHGRTYSMNRGILDATIHANGHEIRLLGVHLKSKRDVEGVDQESMRQQEARLLRAHIESILKARPGTKLIVYGDLNDSPASPTVKTVTGNDIIPLSVLDKNQQSWTYFWQPHEQYSRIDFIMTNAALRQSFVSAESRIIDSPLWQQGSDHRPLLGVFRLDATD
jgi:endonuclease/exonuclease/phosphatase family metal-dependent hydrolase